MKNLIKHWPQLLATCLFAVGLIILYCIVIYFLGILPLGGKKAPSFVFVLILQYLLIKKADHIFVVSENIADWYKKTYSITRPTVLLNVPRAKHIEKTNYFKDTFYLRDDQIIALYQGELVAGRGVDILLESFKKNINDKIVIVFMGYGALEIEIQSASKLYKNIL
jgi:hypothetical protein